MRVPPFKARSGTLSFTKYTIHKDYDPVKGYYGDKSYFPFKYLTKQRKYDTFTFVVPLYIFAEKRKKSMAPRNTQPLSLEKELLQSAGFVRITGLQIHSLNGESSRIEKETDITRLGKYDQNNGKVVIVTEHGDIWIGAFQGLDRDQDRQMSVTIREFAPNGKGAFVPLSNGEICSTHDLLIRAGNPNATLR
ncbi:MAG: hypothetical protein Q7R79_01985 [bacterium]|nr:hypothetical protein [bacterium]